MAESAIPVRLPSNLQKIIYDEVNLNLAYLGVAAPGAALGAAVWRIQRLTFGPGNSLAVEFAEGNAEFDNVWNDRDSFTYS